MRKKYLSLLVTPIGLIGALLGLNSYNSGIGSTVCGGPACHGAASNNTVLNLVTVPVMTNNQYLPNTIYKCTLAVSNTSPGLTHSGFTCVASAGTMSIPTGVTGISVSGGTVGHTSKAPITAGTGIWFFDWNSPSTATTAVTFNIGANVVNGNLMSSGDQWANQVFTFQPPSGGSAPTITNVTVSGITDVNATISGTVNANNANTSSFVEYGLTNAYGSTANTTPNMITGTANTNVTVTLNSLTPGTTYHYRLSALSAMGSANSPDATFTTKPTSVNEFEKGGFSLFPNPSNGRFTIKSSGYNPIQIYVYDGLGRLVSSDITHDGDTHIVDISNSTPGNYFVKIISKGNWYGKTISKQ